MRIDERAPHQRLQDRKRLADAHIRAAFEKRFRRPHDAIQFLRIERKAQKPPVRKRDDLEIVAHEIGARRLRRLKQPRQTLRLPEIVGVEERDPFPPRRVERRVARRAHALIARQDDGAQPRVRPRKPLDLRTRAVT